MPVNNADEHAAQGAQRETRTTFGPVTFSYLTAAIAVPLVLHYHLLPMAFAGLAVYGLTVTLASRLPTKWGGLAHKFALAAIVVFVVLGLFGVGLAFWSYLHGSRGMGALLRAVAEGLDNLRRSLPADIAEALPSSLEDLREQAAIILREHAHRVSAFGIAGLSTFVHIAFGMVIGGLIALHHIDHNNDQKPFAAALSARARTLADAFDKVVFAQVKISGLNTAFTVIYLMVILPLAGVRLPMITILVPLTFIAGLLPVFGNLISTSAIVLISFGTSPHVAIGSLVFLVVIHKLEYFLNARIVGAKVKSTAWELLSAMLVMEAVFGIGGLIAAPVIYTWLKEELKAQDMI
jgi:predicted PurR-regulated permease PerM